MFNYTCIDTLIREIEGVHGGASARDRLLMGINKGSVIFNAISPYIFNVDKEVADYYDVAPVCEKIITTTMSLDSCSTDVNRIPDSEFRQRVRYTPVPKAVLIDLCKKDCREGTAQEHWLNKVEKAGVSIGRTIDAFYFYGLRDAGFAGITQLHTTKVRDMSAHPKFSDLAALTQPNQLASFFDAILDDLEMPMIFMGPRMKELIGLKGYSTTGDTCSEFWDCFMTLLANRRGQSRPALEGLFSYNRIWDHVVGLDINNPTDKHSIIHVIDGAHFRMGMQSNPVFECVTPANRNVAEAEVSTHFTGPQILKEGTSRFYYGMINHADILECEELRDEDSCVAAADYCLELPTPIV